MEREKEAPYSICVLLPEGNTTAVAERYRDSLRRDLGVLPGAGLLPVVPLAAGTVAQIPDPPRLTEPLRFGPPRLVEGSLFLPLEDPAALMGLAPPHAPEVREPAFPLYPLCAGLYIGRIGGRPLPAPPPELTLPLSCSGFRLALIEYRLEQPADGWWDCIEERRIWEVPVRKPRAGGWSKEKKTGRLAGYE